MIQFNIGDGMCECSIDDFIQANHLAPDEVAELRALRVGDTYYMGVHFGYLTIKRIS